MKRFTRIYIHLDDAEMRRNEKFRFQVLLVCAVAVPLFGCVTHYAPPAVENPAHLEFRNTTGVPLSASVYAEASNCSERSVVDHGVAPDAERDITIDGGKDVAVTFFYMVNLVWCTPTFRFHPEKGKHYRMLFTQSGDKCYVSVREAAQDDTISRPVQIIKKKFVKAFLERGPWCEPDDGSG